MSEQCTRLESASNIIDNARFFIEGDESPNLLQQAKHARLGWDLFAEELSAQLLAAGHEWSAIIGALHIEDYHRHTVERRADDLRAGQFADEGPSETEDDLHPREVPLPKRTSATEISGRRNRRTVTV